MRLPHVRLAAALALSLSLPLIAPPLPPAYAAQAESEANDPAMAPLRQFYDALLYGMKHAKQLGVQGRYRRLDGPVSGAFDFETMTKFIIGEDWKTLSDQDRKQLVAAFKRVTVADYARNFDGYDGESFVINPNVQTRGDEKIVATQMTVPNKPAIAFNYRMHKTAAGWRIVDIYLNGYISEVATRRSDFSSTLKNSGAGALIQKLNHMADETLKE